jgi:hypothetical protein
MPSFTAATLQALGGNTPPPIADVGSQSLEGPVSMNRITAPQPPSQGMLGKAASSLAQQNTIQNQATQGASGQNPASPNGYSMNPILMHTSPKRIHSVIKSGLPSIGNLYSGPKPTKKAK